MGNRAVITTEKKDMALYLHWNGGRDSVEGFLKYCELRGFRSPSHDCYGWARLCQVIGNFFGPDGLSVGIYPYGDDESENPGDNGIYVIRGWEIVDRVYPWESFTDADEQREYDLNSMLRDIDSAQPREQQLGAYLRAEVIPVSELRIGDMVYMDRIGAVPKPYEVVGFGTKEHVNGGGYLGKPYVNQWGTDYESNCNNYPHLNGDTCRIVPRKTLKELEEGVQEVLRLFADEE